MSKARILGISSIIAVFAMPRLALAHCPLCTAGAGALALGAAWLGISAGVVGMLIGAFALALSVWTARLIKNQYIPFQNWIIGAAVFLGTVVPIAPLVYEPIPVYVSIVGEYGGVLHNTYALNLFVVGIPFGALVVAATPKISTALTQHRGNQWPYQGLSITFGLLITATAVIEFLL